MPKVSQEEIEKMKAEMKSLKSKITAMQERKAKTPNLFSKLDDLQMQNLIKMYNSKVAKARILKIPLWRPDSN